MTFKENARKTVVSDVHESACVDAHTHTHTHLSSVMKLSILCIDMYEYVYTTDNAFQDTAQQVLNLFCMF